MQLEQPAAQLAIKFDGATKSYDDKTNALGPFSLSVPAGQVVAVIGPSGSGKSTLLKLVNGLVLASSGSVQTLGHEVQGLNATQLRKLRSRVGFVFQDFGVLPRMTALETVLSGSLGRLRFPRLGIVSYPKGSRLEAKRILERVGLADFTHQRVGQLSGGQIQRVAIARALFQLPEILILDEPISSLDPESSKVILQLIRSLAKESKLTVLASLHQVEWAKDWPDRVIGLREGQVLIDQPAEQIELSKIRTFYE